MKSALIQCGDHFENQTRIFSLAMHLRSVGCEPIVMLYSRNSSKIFEYSGVQTIYLDDYRKIADKNCQAFPLDYEKIVFIERARAYFKFNTPAKVRKEKRKIDRDYTAIKILIDKVAPDALFIWNGYTGNVANILRTVFGPSDEYLCWYMERSFFNHSLFVDPIGVNASASISKSFTKKLQPDIPACFTVGKEPSLDSDGLSKRLFEHDYIFVPLQVQTDTNNILYSPHIRKMRGLVISVLDAVEKINKKYDRDIKIVVREHPEEIEASLNLPKHSLIYIRNDGEVNDWGSKALSIVNINSTVGLEAIFLGKPVFSFGRSIYSHKQLGYIVNPKDFYQNLEKALIGEGRVVDSEEVAHYFKRLFFYNTSNSHNFPECVGGKFSETVAHKINKNVPKFLSSKVETLLRDKFSLKVGCYLSPKTRLNLTYRKNSVEVSPDLYRHILKERYGFNGEVSFKLLNGGECENGFDLIIKDSFHENIASQHDIVLDEYLLRKEESV